MVVVSGILTHTLISAGGAAPVGPRALAGSHFPQRLATNCGISPAIGYDELSARHGSIGQSAPGGNPASKKRVGMMGASFLLALQFVAQSSPAANPHDLLEQLGTAHYADREAAAKALDRLGREAIPVLQDARVSRDMEIRTRATALLQQIERSLLTRPTLVWLRFNDLPLAEVVSALSQQTGMKISLVPENLPRWKQERLSLHEPLPLPFWKAVDRFCAAGLLQHDLELRGVPAGNQLSLASIERNTHPVHPISDHGPFRVSLVRLEFHRHVEFAAAPPRQRGIVSQAGLPLAKQELTPPKPRPVASAQCLVQLQVMAEPRLTISQSGALQIIEARDDQGNSLRIDTPGTSIINRGADHLVSSCSAVVHIGAPLNRPDNPGRTIRILRGSVPLRITARQPDPLVVPLATAAGKSFRKQRCAPAGSRGSRRPQQPSE